MKYSELIQFDPITTIVQLADSKDPKKAQKLVESYVVSDTMRDRLVNVVFKQLDWENPEEHKGMLVVGNYGTGKSHLMSFISSVAADAAVVPSVQNADVRSAAEKIAGKFNVIREEIGGVKTPFRKIFVNRLQKHLNEVGVGFSIPTDDAELTNNKEWMAAMMKAYRVQFPGKGLLFVLDEMLDYLRSLQSRELVLALGLMREIGEFANMRDDDGEPYRFYFIGGVQEAIFDSGRFAFVSDSLGRVAERFKQVKIDRTDVKFVIAERLLRKSAAQLEKVEAHLAPFAKCYGDLTTRLEDFKRMFPVHPDFVSVFEKISCVEKRRILDTLSAKMTKLLDQDVPDDQPGLIAFDSYWADVKADATAGANPETKSVIESVGQLDGKIDHGDLRKAYVPLAHRLVDALAVYRLSTDSIATRIGLNAEELRDMLFVYDPVCADETEPALALRDQIQVVMKKLMTAVDGQYITCNPDNGQYYIDVKKTVDVEQLIEKKAATLDDDSLDQAYFEALSNILEVKGVSTVVTDFKIWEYDKIQWFSHKTFRRGYLFFGAPNERSTAQPPRDYYIYFLRPFGKTAFHDEKCADEVFFELKGADDALKTALADYAAATDLAATSSGNMKAAFESRAISYLQKVNLWLREKNLNAFAVTYKGEKKLPQAWLTGVNLRDLAGLPPDETFNFRDQVHALAGHLLESCFCEQAPEYPKFSKFLSAEARATAVRESLRMIAGYSTKQAVVLLEGLKLVDGSGSVTSQESPFAEKIRAKMKEAGAGKVVNRADLLQSVSSVEYFDPKKSRLEPELLVLVLAAMVQSGEIVLAVPGRTFGATDLDALAKTDVEDLAGFHHVAKPKGGNVAGIAAAFRLLGVNVAYVAQLQQLKSDPVIQFQTAAGRLISEAALLVSRLGKPVSFLDLELLAHCGLKDAASRVRAAKELLERLAGFDTPAKLLALAIPEEEIVAQTDNVALIPALTWVAKFCDERLAIVGYFDKAAEHSVDGDAWLAEKVETYQAIQAKIVAVKTLAELRDVLKDADATLKKLETDWIAHYSKLHERARLSLKDDGAKQKIRNAPILKKLRDLSQIEIAPKAELEKFEEELEAMRVCKDFTPSRIQSSALCPDCHYSPRNDGVGTTMSAVLAGMPKRLDAMLEKWTQLVLENLASKDVQQQFDLLAKEEADAIRDFQAEKRFPDPIPSPLLNGLCKALGGLEKVVVKGDDLVQALVEVGPCEVGKLKETIDAFFQKRTDGKDLAKVRFVVE